MRMIWEWVGDWLRVGTTLRRLVLGAVWVFVVVLVAGCGRGADPTPLPPTAAAELADQSTGSVTDATVTIVAMGDSLTEGLGVDEELAYPAQLEERLLADGYDVRVVNTGISGETSSGALTRLAWVLGNQDPDILILETGANDGLRGIDPALTAQNMDELVAELVANDVVVVLAGMQIVQNMGAEYVEEFSAIFPATAERHDAILIPFFLENVAAVRELNQADEIHPTAEGYTVVVETIYPYVLEALGRITK